MSKNHEKSVKAIKNKMNESRARRVGQLAHYLGISRPTVHLILTHDLELSKGNMTLELYMLNEIQPQACVKISWDNLRKYRHNKSILNPTVSIDESWVDLYIQPKLGKKKVWLS